MPLTKNQQVLVTLLKSVVSDPNSERLISSLLSVLKDEVGSSNSGSFADISGNPQDNAALASVLRNIQTFEADDLINRMVNGKVNNIPVATSAINGFHEFDLKYDKDMVRDGKTGWYELFYSVYSNPSNTSTVRYVAFNKKEDLANNIASVVDNGVIVPTSYDVEIFGDEYQFPSFVKEYDDSGAIYYVFAYKLGTSSTWMKKGRTISELQSYPPELIQGLVGVIDFAPVRNPLGGWISGGFAADPATGQAIITTSPTISGVWKTEKFLFDDTTRQAAFDRQADGFVFFKGNRMFYLFQGLNLEHRIGVESHAAIVEVQNQPPYNLIGQPTEVINDISHVGAANPVYINTPDGEEIWFAGGNGIKYLTISNDATPTGRGTSDVVRIERGNPNEVTGNTPLNIYGSVTNSKIGGITATGTGSGVWGFVNFTNFSMFDFRLRFVANALPTTTATIFKAIGTDQSVFHVKVNSAGIVSVVIASNNGATTTLAINDVPIAIGSMNELVGIGNKTLTQFFLIKDGVNSAVNSQSPVVLSNLNVFSLFNDKNDSVAAANQFNGTIYSLMIRKILSPTSTVGLDEVLANNGSAPAKDMTVNNIHANLIYSKDYGQYISMVNNLFYLIDNNNQLNTTLIVGNVQLTLGNFADDTAAAAGGVAVGRLYHNNGALRIRLV